MALECSTCHYLASPGEAAENGGTCPNCTRPYRDQPTPLNSEMSMRNMPEPGMEDTGGNPLQEGMLGDWQNREKRDESYASVRKAGPIDFIKRQFSEPCYRCGSHNVGPQGNSNICSDCGAFQGYTDHFDPEGADFEAQHTPYQGPQMPSYEELKAQPRPQLPENEQDTNWAELGDAVRRAKNEPQFEVTEVIVPDPDSIRTDKEQMEKNADFLDTLGDVGQVAAPIAGGVAGFALGGPLGAGIGAGLAGGGMSALNGENAGQAIGTGLTDAALGGLGGMGAGALGATSLGATEAAEQGATSGGIGSLMKNAWSKIPGSNLQKLYYGTGTMDHLDQGAGQAAQMPVPGGAPQQALPSSYYSAVETPSSQGHIPSNNTDNPEEVDFHEKNDESHEDPLSQIGINGMGGTDLGPDDFFEADSPAFAQFATLLPKILDFATSEKSAAGDPDMEDLHSKLEAEKPGYLDRADDSHGEKIIIALLGGGKGGEEQSDDLLQDNNEPHDPIAEHEATALRPGLAGTCPRCGSVIDPSSQHCPQCALGNPSFQGNPMNMTEPVAQSEGFPGAQGTVAKTAAGPQTPQQQAAVAELLQSEGRGEEVPQMLLEPAQYAKELAKITGNEEPPQDLGQEGPPPPVTPPSQEAQMPVPGMSAPGPGAGGGQMMAAIAKYAATVDGVAERCPKCNSHSTGYLDYEEGKLGCKSCGNTWTGKKMVEKSSSDFSWGDMYRSESEPPSEPVCSICGGRASDPPMGCPDPIHYEDAPLDDRYYELEDQAMHGRGAKTSAERPGEEDEGGFEDHPTQGELTGNHTWTDASGAPIQAEADYKMYSENYDIPDTVHIDAVKPDVLSYTIAGDYGMSHQTELTHEEAQLEHLSFVPVTPAEATQPEAAQEAPGVEPVAAPGEVTDSSVPHEMMTSATDPRFWDTPEAFKLMTDHQQGAHTAPHPDCVMCQDPNFTGTQYNEGATPTPGRTADFNDINPPGVDDAGAPMDPRVEQANRIKSALMAAGVPEEIAHEKAIEIEGETIGRARQMGTQLESIEKLPETEHPLGPSYGSTESQETGPNWMREEGFDSDSRTAGAKFTPWEQRDYIDEMGDARNADKMNLGGTHYEMDDLSESFLWG